MKVSMTEIKKENELTYEELLDMPYKELLKLHKDSDANVVTRERVRKVLKVMRNSFFAGAHRMMNKNAEMNTMNGLYLDVDSMYPNIPIKKEVTE